MMSPDRFKMLDHHIEMLSMMLVPTLWHGRQVIPMGYNYAVREMFDGLLQDIARLRADNDRLFANETEALDRMKRAENRANLAEAKVRAREEEIARLRKQLADCKSSWESYYGHELQDPESEAYRNGYHAGYEAGRDAIEQDLRQGIDET